jgi:hypothetical protein
MLAAITIDELTAGVGQMRLRHKASGMTGVLTAVKVHDDGFGAGVLVTISPDDTRRLAPIIAGPSCFERVLSREDGLTKEEGLVADALCDAANAFGALPVQHPDEPRDFSDAIHRLRDLLAMRIARRHYPKGWPDKDAPAQDD